MSFNPNLKNSKRILAFFLPSLEVGGAEKNVINLLGAIDSDHYLMSLVLSQTKGDLLKDVPKGVLVYNLNAKGYLKILIGLIGYFKQQKPDIFVSSFPHFNLISLLAKRLSGVKSKIVITEHTPFSLLNVTASNFFHKLFVIFPLPYLIKFFYPLANYVICVSYGVKEDLLKIVNLKNIGVIYNPVTCDKIFELSKSNPEHPWFNDSSAPVIISVGRLTKAKDYPNLFKAVSIILKERKVRLLILGAGPEENKLKQFSKKLGLSEDVYFLGFQKNPYGYIRKSSVFALSSRQEGFGNAIIEAMACGTPVVSTNCPSGPDEIIENNKNGILVPASNPEALSAAVLKVINDHTLAKRLSEAGIVRAKDFSVEKSVVEYEKLFYRII